MNNNNANNKVLACKTCNYNCQNCFYADMCGDWMDDPSMGIPMVSATEIEKKGGASND